MYGIIGMGEKALHRWYGYMNTYTFSLEIEAYRPPPSLTYENQKTLVTDEKLTKT